MFVDPHALPIPPECDLLCPTCRHELRGLPSHTCPECGAHLDMNRLVRPWTRLRAPRFSGHERPLPDFGLRCGICEAELAGATSDACPACGQRFDIEAFRPTKRWVMVEPWLRCELPSPIIEMALQREQIPYLANDNKTAIEHYTGVAPGAGRLLVANDFFFELLWLLREMHRALDTAQSAPWTCDKCGEESPGNFDICWNCRNPRPAP